MRPFILSIGICACLLSAAWAQTSTGGGSSTPTIPYGQTFKDFQYPTYENGQLNSMISAATAKGITLDRAETTNLKIEMYENGKLATTVTSPKADLYVADRIMRTKYTVRIDRVDLVAMAQTCDFNQSTKKYLLRDNVKVILKNFDISSHSSGAASSPTTQASETPSTTPAAPASDTTPTMSLTPDTTPHNNATFLDSPGSYANTNAAPTQTPGL